jgi:lipopolysaccharide/colanic/teichoic acid biosynthesis glycosyltransferase
MGEGVAASGITARPGSRPATLRKTSSARWSIRRPLPGAVLFRHERIGRDGRKFQCLKLRTMGSDAEAVLRADAEMYEEYRHYGTARDLLLSVRPGITGAWAVSGRHCVGYPERCEIELAYVRRWTLLSDASALARTVGAVVRPGG